MNKKIMLITLALFIIVSISAVSASESIADTTINEDVDDVTLTVSNDETLSTPDTEVLSDDGNDTNNDTNINNSSSNGTNTNASTESTTIEIDNSMTNDDIQKIFNTLQNNTVVNFAAGEYNNVSLIITNQSENTRLGNITLNGNGATLIGTPNWTSYYTGIFEIQNTDVFNINGFNFIALNVTTANMKTPSCVIIYNTSYGVFENNNVSGGRFGIYVGSKFNGPNNHTLVRNNTVTNVSDMGIISFGSPYSYIVNNTIISPANHGIDVRHGSGPFCVVEGNTIIDAVEGIYIMHSANQTVINNTIASSAIGITCYGSSNVVCDNNTFLNKTKIGFFLGSGYKNIQIGEGNNYSGISFTPMPPTFSYYIVKGDSTYVTATNGTFSEENNATNETYVEVYVIGNDEGDPLYLNNGEKTILNDSVVAINNNTITVKIWKNDDNNHIDENETINVTIDGADYSGLSDITGAVYINLTDLSTGKHSMTVTYPGNDALKSSTWSGIFQIGSNASTIIQFENMNTTAVPSVDSRTGEWFKFNLTDSYGNKLANKTVYIGFNGHVYTKTTDENGSAQLQINIGYQSANTFAIAFLGDDNYDPVFNVALIVVNKATPVLKISKKTYKSSVKTKKLTATLTTAKGNAISGVTVTFKVNSKTYTAKTNSKGIATVTVSLSAKKTYTYTATSSTTNTFNKVTKSSSVVIK